MKNLKKLSRDNMKKVNGGLKHTPCHSYNVTDVTAGAPPKWWQNVETFAHNFWYCPDHL